MTVHSETTAIPRRSGFTMIELVVVIAIIAILASLTAGGIFKVIEGQKKSNTEQALRELDNALKQQWQEVERQAKQDVPCALAQTLAQSSTGYNDSFRAKVTHLKLREQQEFPMTFAEAFLPAGQPGGQAGGLHPVDPKLPPLYLSDLKNLGITKLNNPPQPYESSILLLLALRRGRGNFHFNPDTVGTFTATQSFNDPKNGNINVRLFVDGWGNPLAFFRWPTGSTELDGSNPAAPNSRAFLLADPLDPSGYLTETNKKNGWYYNSLNIPSRGRTKFEQTIHILTKNNGPHAFFMVPTIASAGPDGKWGVALGSGLQANLTVLILNDESDNLYSFRLRLGARGD